MSQKLFPSGFFERVKAKPKHAKPVIEALQRKLGQLPDKIRNVADQLRHGDVQLEDLELEDFESEFEGEDNPDKDKK